MHLLPFRALHPKLDYISTIDSFFDSVREEFRDYYESGFYSNVEEDAIFLYQIQTEKGAYVGLVSCLSIKAYLDGQLIGHEQTIPEKEQKQIQLILKRGASVKPVLLTYLKVVEIEDWIKQYCAQELPYLTIFFDAKKEKHILWKISNQDQIQQITSLFLQKVPHAYIADGHHRASSLAVLHKRYQKKNVNGKYGKLLCAFFSSDQLEISSFNRVIDGLSEISPTKLMAKLSQLFDIEILEQARLPAAPREIAFFIQKEWYLLHWKQHILKTVDPHHPSLDVSLLNEKVLKEILGIEDIRTDSRIGYVEGPKGIIGIQKKAVLNEHNLGFCFHPISLEIMIQLANQRKAMPPKSTWFEPRMKNGIVAKIF